MLNDEAGLSLLGEDETPAEKQGISTSQELSTFQIPGQLVFHLTLRSTHRTGLEKDREGKEDGGGGGGGLELKF